MAVHGDLSQLLHFQNLLMTVLNWYMSAAAVLHSIFDQYQLTMVSVFMELKSAV